MSDFELRVRKYRLTIELDLYGATASESYARALKLLAGVVKKHRRIRIAGVIDRLDLPFGGIEGAPHEHALDGWRCFYELAESDD